MLRLSWDELDPIVRYANDLPCTPGYRFGPRTISDHQFIYVAGGRGTAEIGGHRYDAAAGDLFYYGPGVVHTFTADGAEPFVLYGIHFEWKAPLHAAAQPIAVIDLAEGPAIGDRRPPPRNGAVIGAKGLDELAIGDRQQISEPALAELLLTIIKQYRNGGEKSAVVNRGLLLHILLLLHRSAHLTAPLLSPWVKLLYDVKAKLDQTAELPYERSWLSGWTGYHEDYVSRGFHGQFGLSPHRYHLLKKLEKAKELLEHTDLAVGVLAERLSFQSVHYFCRFFKAQTGQTPLGYRKLSRMV